MAFKLIKHPTRVLVSGKSQSGKTTLMLKLLTKRLIKQVERLIVVCPTFLPQPKYRVLDKFLDEGDFFESAHESTFIEIRTQIEDQKWQVKTLLLIDDQAAETALHTGRKGPFAFLSYNAIWLNLTIIVVTQNLTAVTPAFTDNCENLLVFKTLRRRELDLLGDEFNPFDDKNAFRAFYYYAVGGAGGIPEVKYNFLYVNLNSSPVRFFKGFSLELLINNNNTTQQELDESNNFPSRSRNRTDQSQRDGQGRVTQEREEDILDQIERQL